MLLLMYCIGYKDTEKVKQSYSTDKTQVDSGSFRTELLCIQYAAHAIVSPVAAQRGL